MEPRQAISFSARITPAKESAIVSSQHWRSVPARAGRVWRVSVCICALLLLAAAAAAEPIRVAGYDTWQWNGFTRAVRSETATAGGVVIPSLLADAVTSSSSSSSSSPTSVSLVHYLAAGSGASANADLTGSISGYVYLDANGNGVMDNSDWGISGAEIELSSQGSADVTMAYTKVDGSYTFSGLAAGTYSVTMLTPCNQPGKCDTVGVLVDPAGTVCAPGTVTEDHFTGIVMDAGDTGTNYNFSEAVFPVAAYSKRLLIDDGGIIHTVPEPGSLLLLAVGGLILGGFGFARRRG
jgi:hypothetical protein